MVFIKKWLLRIIGLIIFVIAMLWASENSDPVRLGFLDFKTGEWPVAWWMLAAFVVGVFTGIMMNTWTNARLKMDVRKAKKVAEQGNKKLDQLHAQEPAENSSLPALPVGDGSESLAEPSKT